MTEKNERPSVLLVNRCIVSNERDETLIIKRSPNDSRNAELWEFPGGKLDIGENISDALEREVREETGLIVEPISRLVFVESLVIEDGRYAGDTYVALFGLARVVGGELELSDEHTDARWVGYEEALEQELTEESRKALQVLGKTAITNR